MSDNLEPGTCSTPPGAGAVPRRDYACGAILLGGACKMWPESDGCPTHGVSCPVVPSPTPPGAEADLLPAETEYLLNAILWRPDGWLDQSAPHPNFSRLLTQKQCAAGLRAVITTQATELRRLAAEVERLRERAAYAETSLDHIRHDYTLAMGREDAVLRALHPECPAFPGQPNACTAEECDCFAADNLPQQVKELRATSQAAAEQMREACDEVCAKQLRTMPPRSLAANEVKYLLRLIRALPLPTPGLDAIREAARREGAERALRWAFYEYHDGWMGSDAVVDAYVARGFATLFPAAPEAIANDS